ncbi:MAG: peptidylprolyl isomerase [Burkholderiaceae bacterium]|nr:peptidylprolyl isomerase [Rhodoferax sp.]MCB2007938.1 peptidylprolyl isomerase [Rhodoferax sp.]MCB2030523.1 peptidylprolyl isomerase [Rhodoferax sp.]MCB2039935.1 peptidylprolyl isomerase [Rhodoferax sp.]MCP5264087.1 peptidylprolyl isomerase [Rhodoferax sp.]
MTLRLSRIFWAALLGCGMLSAQAQGIRLPGNAGTVTSPGSGAQRASDYIVAIVNTEPITNLQVRQEMQRLGQELAQRQETVPSTAELAERALERLITERSQIQYAREVGIKIEDYALDEAVQSVARQNQVDVEELHRRLAEEGISRSQFRNTLRDQMVLSRVREREVAQRVRVSELEIDQYLLDQKRASGSNLAEVNIAHILLELPESASAAQLSAARAQAEQIMARVRAGEDFSALARSLSKAPDAAEGGLFGMRAVDRYPQLFIDAVRTLEPGAMTTVRSGAGLHVLRLIDKRLAGAPETSVEQTRVSHILLRPTASMDEQAAIARLQEFRRRILAGEASFEALAKEYSQDGSASQGGDLGWSSAGRFVPEFDAAVAALAPKEIGPPLVSRFGVHLIRVDGRRTVELSVREQRESVRALLREKKLEEAYQSWSRELRSRAYVDLREPPS